MNAELIKALRRENANRDGLSHFGGGRTMSDICTDNRFELIAKYKAKLIEATNIETSADEMAVIDNILFRVWQMGWLDRLEQPTVDAVQVMRCKDCKMWGCPIPIEYTMKEEGYEYCGALWTNTHKDDFCAWGERRTE